MKKSTRLGESKILKESASRKWHKSAACQGKTELFFSIVPADMRKAIKICQSCPVKGECLSEALELHEPYGIWAGLNQRQLSGRVREALAMSRQHGKAS